MTRTRTVRYAAALAGVAAVGLGLASQQTVTAQARNNQPRLIVPRLEVDPLWPKPFPYEKHWALGSVTGLAIDGQDHIWVVNRGTASLQNNEKGPSLATWASECCFGAPQVLEFDADGTLLNNWGGPGQGYVWPQDPAGIAVDAKGNVWIAAGGMPAATGGGRRGAPPAAPGGAAAGGAAPAGGAPAGGRVGRGGAAPGAAPGAAAGGAPAAAAAPQGRGPAAPAAPAVADSHVIKFDKTGKPLLTIGTPGKTDESDTTLNGPQAIAIDDAANEVYVADSGNKRVMVFDANSGAFKRKFGGSGQPFKDVSCVKLAKDGMVYVCDSANNRIQVFKKDGTFVKEGTVKAGTGGMVLAGAGGAQGTTYSFGSVWDIAFSNDAPQRFLYVADGMNKTVWVVQRETLTLESRIGDGGRYPGMFYAVGSVAVDSKGNLYTGEESDGKRVQKFLNKGMTAPRPLE